MYNKKNFRMKKENEFPTKFWVIFGIVIIGVVFGLLLNLDIVEIGQMGVRLVP